MTDKIQKSILKPKDKELFSILDKNVQESILEELNKFEKLLGRQIFISEMEKSENGINASFSFGNLFLT